MTDFETLRKSYTEAKQDQVFAFADKLSSAEKDTLARQLEKFDPAEINEISAKANSWTAEQSDVEPLPSGSQASVLTESPETVAAWRAAGQAAVKRGEVAILLLAGGQGTRLGSSAPKGCYDIGLPSHKSLFQLQAERIAKLGDNVPWYIMTSGPTRGPTESFFMEHQYFGLNPKNVVFFEQGTLPCLTKDGKIILESAGKVSEAPDGNGGVYKALKTGKVLDDMQKRGIKHVHMYCVDNSLVKVGDPVFIGFSAERKLDVATKVVRKRSSNEQVGVIASRGGKPSVIEYSEITPELREARDPAHPDLLKLRAANIVNHYYSVDFLQASPDLAKHAMPFHVAHKKIPFAGGAGGETVKPDTPNGIKLEQFVFDIFSEVPLAKFASLEVDRKSEFSPVKNAPGSAEDSPDTARHDLLDEGRRWLLAAGAQSAGPTEIAPRVSYDGEGLEKFAGQAVTEAYIA